MSESERAVAAMPPRVLLIDLENCPAELGQLPETLSEFSKIIVCFAGIEPKVPLGLVIVLAKAIHEGRLEFVGMDRGGKNAADFGLAFWAGRLVSEMPKETSFTMGVDLL
ncbi:MAG: PIN domain-containing protein [Magnetococcus sp. DMHC-6]